MTNPPAARMEEVEIILKKGRGFGRERCKYPIICYRHGVEGHKALECLEKHNAARRNEARAQVTQANRTPIVGENLIILQQEQGENLMVRECYFNPRRRSQRSLNKQKEYL